MNYHFVCTECGFTSKFPGTCQNDDCIKQGLPLKKCYCEDGKHRMVKSQAGSEESTEEENTEGEGGEENENKGDRSITLIDLDD